MSGLRGKTVYLKTPHQNDVSGYIRHLWSDEETMRDVGGTHVMDDERALRWFTAWIEPGNDDRRYFLVVRKEDDVPVGEACFRSYVKNTGIATYGMKVEAKHRGNGYAREALELLLRFYFGTFGGQTMVDDIALENIRAQKMFIKFGFEHDPSVGKIMTSMGGDNVFWVRLNKGKFTQLYGL